MGPGPGPGSSGHGEGEGKGQIPPFCDPPRFSPLLQPEEEMETVFDMEPSSTSSTPTSLVSQCLLPGGQVRRGCLEGGYSSGTVGAPAFSARPGYWGGDGPPSLGSLL